MLLSAAAQNHFGPFVSEVDWRFSICGWIVSPHTSQLLAVSDAREDAR